MSPSVPLSIPYEELRQSQAPFQVELEQAALRVLRSGWYILGPEVEQFEARFAEWSGVRHCIGVGNGMDALTLSLMALQLPPGTEVIVPAHTFIATILAVLQAGLTPVLAEPDPLTSNICPRAIEAAISSRTGAIVVVHLYGKLCAMPKIRKIAERHSLHLLEDCAQAHGASLNGQKAGSFGAAGAFSFYPVKTLGAMGDAGAIATNDDHLAERLRMLRNYGSRSKYVFEMPGLNSRLDELQAALLGVKLSYLDRINQHKQALAALYTERLPPVFQPPVAAPGYADVFHIYCIHHPERDRLQDFLRQKGVGTAIHYPVPPHLQAALQGRIRTSSLPITEQLCRTCLSLPISYGHTTAQIEQVIRYLCEFAESDDIQKDAHTSGR